MSSSNANPEREDDNLDYDNEEDQGIIRCICGFTEDDGFTIQCENCLVWQHAICRAVELQKQRLDKEYRTVNEPRKKSKSIPSKHKKNFLTSDDPTNSATSDKKKRNNSSRSKSYDKKVDFEKISASIISSDEVVQCIQSIFSSPELIHQSDDIELTLNSIKQLSITVVPRLPQELTLEAKLIDPSTSRQVGLFSTEKIPQSSFIYEYKGRVNLKTSYVDDPKNHYYLLRLPRPYVAFHPIVDLCVDARTEGDLARNVRRSCTPNLSICSVGVSDTNNANNTPIVALALFAQRDIDAGEELTMPWDWEENELPAISKYDNNKCAQYLLTPEGRRMCKVWRQAFFGTRCTCYKLERCKTQLFFDVIGLEKEYKRPSSDSRNSSKPYSADPALGDLRDEDYNSVDVVGNGSEYGSSRKNSAQTWKTGASGQSYLNGKGKLRDQISESSSHKHKPSFSSDREPSGKYSGYSSDDYRKRRSSSRTKNSSNSRTGDYKGYDEIDVGYSSQGDSLGNAIDADKQPGPDVQTQRNKRKKKKSRFEKVFVSLKQRWISMYSETLKKQKHQHYDSSGAEAVKDATKVPALPKTGLPGNLLVKTSIISHHIPNHTTNTSNSLDHTSGYRSSIDPSSGGVDVINDKPQINRKLEEGPTLQKSQHVQEAQKGAEKLLQHVKIGALNDLQDPKPADLIPNIANKEISPKEDKDIVMKDNISNDLVIDNDIDNDNGVDIEVDVDNVNENENEAEDATLKQNDTKPGVSAENGTSKHEKDGTPASDSSALPEIAVKTEATATLTQEIKQAPPVKKTRLSLQEYNRQRKSSALSKTPAPNTPTPSSSIRQTSSSPEQKPDPAIGSETAPSTTTTERMSTPLQKTDSIITTTLLASEQKPDATGTEVNKTTLASRVKVSLEEYTRRRTLAQNSGVVPSESAVETPNDLTDLTAVSQKPETINKLTLSKEKTGNEEISSILKKELEGIVAPNVLSTTATETLSSNPALQGAQFTTNMPFSLPSAATSFTTISTNTKSWPASQPLDIPPPRQPPGQVGATVEGSVPSRVSTGISTANSNSPNTGAVAGASVGSATGTSVATKLLEPKAQELNPNQLPKQDPKAPNPPFSLGVSNSVYSSQRSQSGSNPTPLDNGRYGDSYSKSSEIQDRNEFNSSYATQFNKGDGSRRNERDRYSSGYGYDHDRFRDRDRNWEFDRERPWDRQREPRDNRNRFYNRDKDRSYTHLNQAQSTPSGSQFNQTGGFRRDRERSSHEYPSFRGDWEGEKESGEIVYNTKDRKHLYDRSKDRRWDRESPNDRDTRSTHPGTVTGTGIGTGNNPNYNQTKPPPFSPFYTQNFQTNQNNSGYYRSSNRFPQSSGQGPGYQSPGASQASRPQTPPNFGSGSGLADDGADKSDNRGKYSAGMKKNESQEERANTFGYKPAADQGQGGAYSNDHSSGPSFGRSHSRNLSDNSSAYAFSGTMVGGNLKDHKNLQGGPLKDEGLGSAKQSVKPGLHVGPQQNPPPMPNVPPPPPRTPPPPPPPSTAPGTQAQPQSQTQTQSTS